MILFREMEEITTFVKGAISDDQCLGGCLYIHGVPGTGKVSFFDLLYCFLSLLYNEALTWLSPNNSCFLFLFSMCNYRQ